MSHRLRQDVVQSSTLFDPELAIVSKQGSSALLEPIIQARSGPKFGGMPSSGSLIASSGPTRQKNGRTSLQIVLRGQSESQQIEPLQTSSEL